MSKQPHLKTAAWKAITDWYKANTPPGGWECALCGHRIDPSTPPRSAWSLSIDHIVPVAKGGAALDMRNTQPVHVSCNSSKSARGDIGYMRAGRFVVDEKPKGSRIW